MKSRKLHPGMAVCGLVRPDGVRERSMKTELRFETMEIMGSHLGAPASVPDLVGIHNVQRKSRFDLSDREEIYEGYGTLRGSYPYAHFNTYDRKLSRRTVRTAVLENEALRAVFLPDYGGRLWQLYDRKAERDILYTNDVLRFSNLALRNAWFSGGVEWNISMIGHTPFTTSSLYTARLTREDGSPVLRMYMYERVRQVEYQMDFWLEEDTLRCRMRISNSGRDVVPMYWWSNIAVPEYPGGRLVVPASSAYMSSTGDVSKTPFPMINGIDMSYYAHTGRSIDYFFDQDKSAPSYIADLSSEGVGFLHVTSARMQSHKLFSWGHDGTGDRWQAFLTEKAGKYIEVQGGLGKTQYGCIPMAPNTAWEWTEIYSALQVDPALVHKPYAILESAVRQLIRDRGWDVEAEQPFTRVPGESVRTAGGYGALRNVLRETKQEKRLSAHLMYTDEDPAVKFWLQYLSEGRLPEMDPEEAPLDFVSDAEIYDRLKESVGGADRDNWYAWYQLGVYSVWKEHLKEAEDCLMRSMKLRETAWACHALCSLYLISGHAPLANLFMRRGLELRTQDLSYVKEGLRLLILGEGYQEVLRVWPLLDQNMHENDRLRYDCALALYRTGRKTEAADLLVKLPDMLEDLREGADHVAELRREMEAEK